MFGWWKPACPVDVEAKRWIEGRLAWLVDQFGYDIFARGTVILPTAEFFPDPLDGSEASVRKLLDRVCEYMQVDPAAVALQFFTGTTNLWIVNQAGKAVPTSLAGLYEAGDSQTIIHIESSTLWEVAHLVGTMAHELAHHRLLGEGRLAGDEFDNELLTDLTALFLGFGIFLGNSPRNWDCQYSRWPGTRLRRPEYMTLPMYGYALAHSAWHRGETRPAWWSYLSHELKPNVRQSLRFLRATGDSKFQPVAAK
jgi:hypothetical protein